ncbi:glycosyltransferase [Maritimibacter sp. UBA3975]|uniref:capsular polysaccharide export protein, LipB/KpsS family n=1 Tax=Maritimibacter sp. UBA3975 TaxID=1946833 RepID=UPI0025B7EE47|nr:glycosyltransferase [Maritimibacter sp. UBA3975]
MSENQSAFQRFCELLDTRQIDHDPERDIRDYVLALRERPVGCGYVRANIDTKFGANLKTLFPHIKAVDDEGVDDAEHFLLTGTIFRDPEFTHTGGVRFLNKVPVGADLLFFEPAFVATSHSWAHAFREGDPEMACLGYVYDDMAYYFMADYPNRLIQRLNSELEFTQEEQTRARGLIDRMVARRISKYNAQPMEAPTLPGGYARRVLVCDQAFADASTVYGKVDEAAFEEMLFTAIRENPDAQIIVKTHPDSSWEKSKRMGYYTHLESTERVVILTDPVNPYTVFDMVDTVYVGTSQMGLEALFAGKKVVTFGVPFYAGWGLTDDRQAIPHRHRTRTLEDIFHAFYIWYTIYHVPGCAVPSRVEDALDFIEAHRPYSLPEAVAEAPAEPKVSIIIPVHGVENYIEECIRSVQRQTLREIEIIPVNDVSPDGSQAIIDRLAKEDARIRPMMLDKNVGQGFARNKALGVARGDYVWFIDADDYMPNPAFLAKAVEMAERTGSDMVRGRKIWRHVETEGVEGHTLSPDVAEQYFPDTLERLAVRDMPLLMESWHFWLWLYRRDFVERIGLRFELTQMEERPFVIQALLAADTVSLLAEEATRYRVRHGSTMKRKRTERDNERFLQNFSLVFEQFKQAGAAERDSPLRPHFNIVLSQFVHLIFLGATYSLARERDGEVFRTLWDSVRSAFDNCHLRGADFDGTRAGQSLRHQRAGAYQLIIEAVRADRRDLVDRAVDLAPIPQDELMALYLTPPATEREAGLVDAVNAYARNDLVRTAKKGFAAPGQKPRIIVHIGATKTGSTYIQHLMETNRPALLREGVWYPEVGLFWQTVRPHKQAGHSEFTPAAMQNAAGLKAHIERGVALAGGKIHTIVLSSEAFFLQRNAVKIAHYFSDYPVEMVCYLRRQDEWANAQYAEFVAGGAVGRVDVSFEAWLADEVTRERLDYRNPLDAWAEAIGPDNVTARLFGKEGFEGGDLLTDFAHVTNLPMLRELPEPDGLQANSARLSTAHVELIRMYNTREFKNRDAYFTFIETVTTGLQAWREERGLPMTKPWYLTPDLSERIVAETAESNAEIAKRYFGREDGTLFPATPAQGPEEEVSLHPEELALVERAFLDTNGLTDDRPIYAGVSKPVNVRAGQPRIVNYGHFGWRLWLLAPIVDRLYVSKAMPDQSPEFLREPAEYVRRHWSHHRPLQVGLMYPNADALGAFKVWVPVLSWGLRVTGNHAMVADLKRDPILFVRRSPSKIGQLLGRLLFPRGEMR